MMNDYRRMLFLLMLFCGPTNRCDAQLVNLKGFGDAIRRAEKSIAQLKGPGISKGVIAADRKAIEESMPLLRQALVTKKFSNDEINDLVRYTRIDMRRGSNALKSDKSLTRNLISKDVLRRGKVRVKSTPSEGRVLIDGRTQPGSTEVTVWPKQGEHFFTVSKNGFIPKTKKLKVKAQQRYSLDFKLERIPRMRLRF